MLAHSLTPFPAANPKTFDYARLFPASNAELRSPIKN